MAAVRRSTACRNVRNLFCDIILEATNASLIHLVRFSASYIREKLCPFECKRLRVKRLRIERYSLVNRVQFERLYLADFLGHCASDDKEPPLFRYKEECEEVCLRGGGVATTVVEPLSVAKSKAFGLKNQEQTYLTPATVDHDETGGPTAPPRTGEKR